MVHRWSEIYGAHSIGIKGCGLARLHGSIDGVESRVSEVSSSYGMNDKYHNNK